jgi:excisionase family DNA binding protein
VSGSPASGVVGGVAIVDGLACAALSRALVDWRRAVPAGIAPGDFAKVEQAVAAMREAGGQWLEGVERQRLETLPSRGSSEVAGKREAAESDAWISTNDAAAILGLTARRVRQLATSRQLESMKVGGRMCFRRGQVLRRAMRRAT